MWRVYRVWRVYKVYIVYWVYTRCPECPDVSPVSINLIGRPQLVQLTPWSLQLLSAPSLSLQLSLRLPQTLLQPLELVQDQVAHSAVTAGRLLLLHLNTHTHTLIQFFCSSITSQCEWKMSGLVSHVHQRETVMRAPWWLALINHTKLKRWRDNGLLCGTEAWHAPVLWFIARGVTRGDYC